MTRRLLALLALASAMACRTPATQPHEMSEAGHERAAAAEQKTAEQHLSLYDPAQRYALEQCVQGEGSPCWTTVTNPTEQHKQFAERHPE